MKISKLFIAFVFASSVFAITPAQAKTKSPAQGSSISSTISQWLSELFGNGADNYTGTTGSSSGSGSTGGASGSGASLPINNNVWFLVIAAGLVGCKVIISKSKQNELTAEAVKAN